MPPGWASSERTDAGTAVARTLSMEAGGGVMFLGEGECQLDPVQKNLLLYGRMEDLLSQGRGGRRQEKQSNGFELHLE